MSRLRDGRGARARDDGGMEHQAGLGHEHYYEHNYVKISLLQSCCMQHAGQKRVLTVGVAAFGNSLARVGLLTAIVAGGE